MCELLTVATDRLFSAFFIHHGFGARLVSWYRTPCYVGPCCARMSFPASAVLQPSSLSCLYPMPSLLHLFYTHLHSEHLLLRAQIPKHLDQVIRQCVQINMELAIYARSANTRAFPVAALPAAAHTLCLPMSPKQEKRKQRKRLTLNIILRVSIAGLVVMNHLHHVQ